MRQNQKQEVYTLKAKQKTIIAICYDFDKTLSPDDMQAQGYIQSVGYDVEEFWRDTDKMARENGMDSNIAYMLKMVQEARGNLILTKEALAKYGEKVRLFPGVSTWFQRINAYAAERDAVVEHYIISSGLKEMIDGTEIARNGELKEVYANSFFYDEKGVAVWPAQVVNYTNKTQFLFRIEKGVLDINDQAVNDYLPDEESRIPFRNMIYIGDSDTDVPCMKLVYIRGGHPIGVYDPKTKDKSKVYKMMTGKRIKYFCPADYRENRDLEGLVKTIIDRTVANEALERKYRKDLKESRENTHS